MLCSAAAGGEGRLFREDFEHLQRWEPLTFPKIKKHSLYAIEKTSDGGVLRTESDASASGLSWRGTYNIYEYPLIRWRWKAMGTYVKGDATTTEQFLTVPARSRATVFPKEDLGEGETEAYDFGSVVETTNDVPLVVERPQYFLFEDTGPGGDCRRQGRKESGG